MNSPGNNPFNLPSQIDLDEVTGTTKVQRDSWRLAFGQQLDESLEVGNIMRRWQGAGVNQEKIALMIYIYVTNPANPLRERKARGRSAKKSLIKAIQALEDLEVLYRAGNPAAADRIAAERNQAQTLLSRASKSFSTKRLGVSRSWTELAKIEGLVFEATNERPTPQELVSLIRAGRYANGQQPDLWEQNPENIRKGLKTFKKNNPLQSLLWIKPSQEFYAIALPIEGKQYVPF